MCVSLLKEAAAQRTLCVCVCDSICVTACGMCLHKNQYRKRALVDLCASLFSAEIITLRVTGVEQGQNIAFLNEVSHHLLSAAAASAVSTNQMPACRPLASKAQTARSAQKKP
jgi:hypothetical protein